MQVEEGDGVQECDTTDDAERYEAGINLNFRSFQLLPLALRTIPFAEIYFSWLLVEHF